MGFSLPGTVCVPGTPELSEKGKGRKDGELTHRDAQLSPGPVLSPVGEMLLPGSRDRLVSLPGALCVNISYLH